MYHPLIYDNVLDTIGNTPMVRLNNLARGTGIELLGKMEMCNPGGSIKDRIALRMINDLEQQGKLKPGGTLVEATSGNMGIGIAMVAAQRGYHCILVIPEKMSRERTLIINALGGEVVRTPTEVPLEHPDSFMSTARRIASEREGAVFVNQFYNPANPETHYRTTAREIWEQTEGEIDAFVMGMGTGGTITGVSRYLKEMNPDIRIIGADPPGSIIKTYFDKGGYHPEDAHIYMVEGIGEDFIPDTLKLDHVDEIHWVTDRESFAMARRIMREEGIFCGGSSGSMVHVALKVAPTLKPGARIVVVLPDSGYRYLSKFIDDDWLQEKGLSEE